MTSLLTAVNIVVEVECAFLFLAKIMSVEFVNSCMSSCSLRFFQSVASYNDFAQILEILTILHWSFMISLEVKMLSSCVLSFAMVSQSISVPITLFLHFVLLSFFE